MTRLDTDYAHFRAAHSTHCCIIKGACWEYIDCGAGTETVLLLPGAMGVADTAFQYCLALAPRYRVLSLGYPDTLTSVAALADGVAALLAALGIQQVHIVGGSYSAMVAQVLVRQHSSCMATLILTHGGLPRRSRIIVGLGALLVFQMLPLPLLRGMLVSSTLGFLPAVSPSRHFWRSYFAALIARLPRAFYLARIRAALDFDLCWRLAPLDNTQWNGRILIVEADNDAFFGAKERAALRELYPSAELHCLRGGHNSALDQIEATIAIISTFLQQTAP